MKYMSPWIFTTNQCNLRCPYCYVKWNDNKMSKETYDKINSTFIGMLDTGELDFVVYRLAGGEPTLVFKDWKNFVEDFLAKCGSKGFVSIITNLTVLTDDMLEFFEKHKDKIGFGVSLDGYSYSKPFINGQSSAEIVKANIDKLLNIGIQNIDISTVIDANSFGDGKVNIKLMKKYKVKLMNKFNIDFPITGNCNQLLDFYFFYFLVSISSSLSFSLYDGPVIFITFE